MRSGCLKSAMAAPSRRNSGLEATETSVTPSSRRISSIWSPVPTGTVDLVTTTVPGSITLASSRTASNTKVRSAWPSPRRAGVPTAMNTASAPFDPFDQVLGEGQPAVIDVELDERFEARLPDRHLARVQAVDLGAVLVDAAHAMAEVGEAGARHEPDVTGADHRDAHSILLLGLRSPALSRRAAQ